MKDLVSRYKKDGFVFEKKVDKGEARSQRNELMKQIHEIYLKDAETQDRIRCKNWLVVKRLNPMIPKNVQLWKDTSGEYYKNKITPASMASYWLSHVPTEDLFFLVSIGKDKLQRKESFNKWLFWAIKPEKK
jgi:hypothetical protein